MNDKMPTTMLCEYCGEPIPSERGKRSKYCSDMHMQAYTRRRTSARLGVPGRYDSGNILYMRGMDDGEL